MFSALQFPFRVYKADTFSLFAAVVKTSCLSIKDVAAELLVICAYTETEMEHSRGFIDMLRAI